jgi:hypothetical protein
MASCCVHGNQLCVPQNVKHLHKLKILASEEWLCSMELVGTSFQLLLQQTNVAITKQTPGMSHHALEDKHSNTQQKTVL